MFYEYLAVLLQEALHKVLRVGDELLAWYLKGSEPVGYLNYLFEDIMPLRMCSFCSTALIYIKMKNSTSGDIQFIDI